MINLSSEPVLTSMVLTRDAVWKHDYRLPRGMEFPDGTTAEVRVTDRSGAELVPPLEGVVSDNRVDWLVTAPDHADITAGANFEMFITVPDDGVYKVRYGRVVRKEARFPAAPEFSSAYDGAIYTDSLQRTALGPFWVQKKKKTVLHDNSDDSLPWGMGNDFILNDESATHWYAPLRSDSMKVSASLLKFAGGSVTICLCSNYTMTNWLGIKFDTTANTVRPVTGGATPTDITNQGSTVANTVSTVAPDPYTVYYNFATNTLSLFKGASLTPLLTWVDEDDIVQHGEGHRYIGVIFKGDLLTVGPQLTAWSAKDDL